MSDLYVQKTFNTPEVKLLFSEGIFSIEGRSIPEDPGAFFDKILKHLSDYYTQPQPLTTFNVKLEYINSGSSKILLEILRQLKKEYDNGKDCLVNWYYEEDDESIQDLGLHYQSTIKIPFKLIAFY